MRHHRVRAHLKSVTKGVRRTNPVGVTKGVRGTNPVGVTKGVTKMALRQTEYNILLWGVECTLAVIGTGGPVKGSNIRMQYDITYNGM
eukprot:7895325-Pyramimonas_sp.AAC.1